MSDYIPNEIQREILIRVPVKSLLRFTTVCKSWYALITNPKFIASHLNHNLNRTVSRNKNNAQALLIRHFDRHEKEEHYTLRQDDETFVEKFTTLEFPLSIPFGFYRIVGSCMGLVCLSDDLFGDLKNIVIWNPSIRKIVEIGMPKKPEWPHLFVLGFGVCPVTFDPKIVKIAYRTEYSENFVTKYTVPPHVEIYSHRSGTWSNALCASPPYSMIDFLWSQAFVNGAIHWVANDKRVEGVSRSLVMSFDLVNESFHEITLPKVLADEHLSHLFATIYRGFLCVLQYVRDVESCCIWIMREYGVVDSWTEVFTINLPGGVMKVVGFRKNGDILLAMRNNDLVSYNPFTEQMKSLGLVGNIRSFYADTYMENLLLLDGQSQFREDEN